MWSCCKRCCLDQGRREIRCAQGYVGQAKRYSAHAKALFFGCGDWHGFQNRYSLPETNTDVSKNNGTPKSSILIGFSITNHPFWGTPIFGNIHIDPEKWCLGDYFSLGMSYFQGRTVSFREGNWIRIDVYGMV